MKYSLVILLLLFLPLTLQADKKKAKSVRNFKLLDVSGKKHELKAYKGKTVVLEWTNLDCPFVKKFYSDGHMQKWQDKYTKKGVVWLTICSSAKGKQGEYSNEELKKRLLELKSKASAYLIDDKGKVGKMFKAKTTPHVFVIKEDMTLAYSGAVDSIRTTDSSKVEKAQNYLCISLDAILKGEEVPLKKTVSYGCAIKY